jgi:DNA invertase Pin-like site-specific DNA recombinase
VFRFLRDTFHVADGLICLICDMKTLILESNVTDGGDSMKVGYRRVSTIDQSLDRQELGTVERIFEEKVSGKNTERAALQDMIAFVREGDEVVVYSIDRLARDLRDLQSIIQTLLDKRVSVTFLSERLSFSADKDDAFSRLQLQLMGAFAEFERRIIRKRQAEGIAKAKSRGVYKGRKKQVDDNKIIQMKREGLKITEIASALSVSRMTVYRALDSAARS